MAKIEINTGQIKAAGEEMQVIASDYNKLMTELFTKIENIEKEGIWVSENDNGASRKFIANVLKDKEPALYLADDMKHLGSRITTYASNISAIADIRAGSGSTSRIKVDTDKIATTVLPTAKKQIEELETALSAASKVNFPNGENDFSSVISDLTECKNEAKKHYTWLANLNESLNNIMTNTTEDISALKITDIKKRTSVVK